MDGNLVVALGTGVLVPFAVSYLKNVKWSKWVKVFLAAAVSMAASVLGLLAQGDLHSIHGLLANSAIVFAAAQTFYGVHFQGTDFNVKLEGAGPFADSA